MSHALPTLSTVGTGRVSYRYGTGPLLGAIRIGTRHGVAYWMQADRVTAPATSRNAWTVIGPLDDYAGHAEAADAYASRHQAQARAAGLATIKADPVPAPVAMVAQPVQQAQGVVSLGGRYVALADGGVEWVPDAPAMVPQPVQQQQAQARKPRPARGERRNVLVRASDTGETFRVLTSVAGTGFAMIEDVPSNLHRAGELRGMLITHGPIRKAVVFASIEEGAAYAEQSRRNGWGHRYSPAVIVADPAPVDAAPAMVPQQAQQQQGRDMRAASTGPAPEILDVSELLERIQAATGPAVVWTAPDAETPRVPLEPLHPAPVILLAGLAGLLAAFTAFAFAFAA